MHSIFRKPIIRQWMDDESKPVLLSVTPKNVALGLCVWCTWTPPTKKNNAINLRYLWHSLSQHWNLGWLHYVALAVSLSLSWVWCLFGSYWITARGVLLITSTTSSSTSAQAPWSHPRPGIAAPWCSAVWCRDESTAAHEAPRAIAL